MSDDRKELGSDIIDVPHKDHERVLEAIILAITGHQAIREHEISKHE
jgi:hypothetical protein